MGFFAKLFNRQPKPGKPRPVTDDSFEQDVLASDLPAVVDFSSPKCAPCQVMKGLLDEIGPDYVGRVNIFKMNVDENPRTAEAYRIMSVPTLIFFRKGRARETISGLIPLQPLRQKLDRLAR
jgi:thioredoxin 1